MLLTPARVHPNYSRLGGAYSRVQVLVNEQFAAFADRKKAKEFCVAAVIAVLVATLWPLNPFPRNGVMWLQGTTGLRFEEAGLVTSNVPLGLIESHGTESYTLELLLRPASRKTMYTILGFDVPNGTRELLVRQWRDSLLVTHDASVESDRTKTIKFDVDHVFRPGRDVLVTISSGPGGTSVYLDGRIAQSFPSFRISRGELSGKIVLGTSPMTYQPWAGELRGLSIYSKEMTAEGAFRHYREWTDPSGHPDLDGAIARYGFAETAGSEVRNEVVSGPNLQIPATFTVPHKAILRSPEKEFQANRRYAIDLMMNIAGFVPLGLIGCAYLSWTRSHWKAIFFTILACGMLSFMIEVLQYFIPRRGSGTTDIITNTLGAALGVALLQTGAVRRALKKMKLIRTAQPRCLPAWQTAQSTINLPENSF